MGGRAFINKDTGENPAVRIPTKDISNLSCQVNSLFAPQLDSIELVTAKELLPKEDHGDLDFICLDLGNRREKVRDFCERAGFPSTANGPMEHILFPFNGTNHQVDLIFCGDVRKYEAMRYFYSRPVVFNAVVGHLARSIGYKFSTEGLLLHVTDKRKQNYFHLLTRNFDEATILLGLKNISDEELFSSPETFASWIISSPRFDTDLFVSRHNRHSHRDAQSTDFCQRVYEIIENSHVESELPPSTIDFTQPEFNLGESLEFERRVLGEQIYQDTLSECERRSKVAEPIVSGDMLIEMGLKPGPIFKEIIQDVSTKFDKETPVDEIVEHIRKTYFEEEENV